MENTVRLTLSEEILLLLTQCIGKKLHALKYMSLGMERSAYGNIGLLFDGLSLELSNTLIVTDVDGKDDYARLKISTMTSDTPTVSLEDCDFLQETIEDDVMDIQIISDVVTWEGEAANWRLEIDVAIEVDMKSTAIVLQKDVWFSEEIRILEGTDYQSRLLPINTGWEFEPESNATYSRSIRSLSIR